MVSSLLGASLESEESRIRETQVPRTTYREAKRRLFEAGLLRDRYLPHPDILGVQRVTLLVTRPRSDEKARVVKSLCEIPGAISVWSGAQLAFAVVFHRSVESGASFLSSIQAESFGSPLTSIQFDPREEHFPVFFDFEGAWNHLCNRPGTTRYPRPLLGASPLRARARRAERTRTIASELMGRPFSTRAPGLGAHLLGPAALPRSERRLLRDGAMDWRVVLQLDRHLAYRGRDVSSAIFILGRLREGRTLPALFQDLAGACGVSPILLAENARQVVMVGLGTGDGATPRAATASPPRRTVRSTLRENFETFDSIREPVSALQIHRFLRFDDGMASTEPT